MPTAKTDVALLALGSCFGLFGWDLIG